MDRQAFDKLRSSQGFIAALDQSGGSTPRALEQYGIPRDGYADDDEMFDLIHVMRTRIVTSPSFDGDRILAAILFEDTMDREIDGRGSADYLWTVKKVATFLKIDKGLAELTDGVQVMKPMPGLDGVLARAVDRGALGTKMRSVIKLAHPGGVKAVVEQQFEVATQILEAGLVPIIEPEIDIHSPEKAKAEELLRTAILEHLDQLGADRRVMIKVTLPETDDFYTPFILHPRVLRVVALSGGYSRDEANARLTRNHGMVASFSRALTEGLTVDQTDHEFDAELDRSIASIFAASIT